MRAARIVCALAAVLLLGACGSLPDLSNRAACAPDGSRAWVVSQWGPLGIAATLHAADAATICTRSKPGP